MGHLPIPAAVFFNDFASDVLEYNVLSNNILIGTYYGILNTDEDGNYIGFLMSEQPQISIGNIVRSTDGMESFKICQIAYDLYNGQPELLKAYY